MNIKFQTLKVVAVCMMATTLLVFTGCKSQQKAVSSIEAPQPTLINEDAKVWAKVHTTELIQKYMATADNKIDPDEMRLLFKPIGYDGGSNTVYYRDAERYLVDTLYSVMLERAVRQGKTEFVIFTGPSASGKSTAAREMDFSNTGLVYDAAFNSYKKLAGAIQKAQRYGMKNIRLIAVYNTIRNCFKNSVDRGKKSGRFIHIPYMIESFGNNVHKMELMKQNFPNIEYYCFDKRDNVVAKRVSINEACQWDFHVTQDDITYLLNVLRDEIDKGDLTKHQLAYIAGDLLSIEGLSNSNRALAQEINSRIRALAGQD
ncbi:MAG: ATP-binding protein [Prevotella sp.]|nr:ATP-binding protein [Prevotella sp.]